MKSVILEIETSPEEISLSRKISRFIRNEHVWLNSAIFAAFVFSIMVALSLYWVYLAPDNTERVARVQIAGAFGTSIAAIITFLTVVRSSLISARQADAQLKALDNQTAQLELTRIQFQKNESVENWKLFRTAVEMISSNDDIKILSGITTFEALSLLGDQRLVMDTMNMIVTFINSRQPCRIDDSILKAALHTLDKIFVSNRTPCTMEMNLTGEPPSISNGSFFTKVIDAKYNNVEIWGSKKEVQSTLHHFKNCEFEHCSIMGYDDNIFEKCRFDSCRFHEITSFKWLSAVNSDFSNSIIYSMVDLPNMSGAGNYFKRGASPIDAIRGKPKKGVPSRFEKNFQVKF